MATIRVTDLDVSPNMTKVVAVGIIHLPPAPHPPASTGTSPAPGARGESTSQSPQAQSHTPGYPPKPENRMIVYDMTTKRTVACVFPGYVRIITSNAASVNSSLKLDGETTSVRVSYDSRYALINHAPDVRFIFRCPRIPVDPENCLQEMHLWDLSLSRIACKFTGQKQGRHVIRSCFGGVDGNFVASGSEGTSPNLSGIKNPINILSRW